MVVTAIGIQQDVGGNLADILDTITETIRERVRILGEIRVLTAQQRITGFVLACLPFGLGTLIYFLNPEYILDLFVPGPLLIIPGGALFMEFIGFLVIRKIVDIKV
jgi:tight adherence protein B